MSIYVTSLVGERDRALILLYHLLRVESLLYLLTLWLWDVSLLQPNGLTLLLQPTLQIRLFVTQPSVDVLIVVQLLRLLVYLELLYELPLHLLLLQAEVLYLLSLPVQECLLLQHELICRPHITSRVVVHLGSECAFLHLSQLGLLLQSI